MQNPNSNSNTPQVWADVQLVTPAIAAKMLTECEYPGQRVLRPFLVARLARQMVLNRWKFNAIKLVHLGDKTYLVDGQHRLRAINLSETAQIFCVMHSICKNEFEVAEEYNSCGTVAGARTNADGLRAGGSAERLNLSKSHFAKFTAAANIILTEFSPNPNRFLVARDQIEQDEVMQEFKDAFLLYFDSVAGAIPELMRPLKWSGFLAAALIIFDTDKNKADQFFRAFAHDSAQFPATRALERFVLPLSGGGAVSQLHVARAVVSAWNYFYARPQGAIKTFGVQNVEKPIWVSGSRYYTGQQNISPLALTFRAENYEVKDATG